MYDRLNGSGLIAFSDPASAKACLGLVSILTHLHPELRYTVVSNKSYDFYNDWNIPVTVAPGFSFTQLEQKTDWVFTGTSHPESSRCFEVNILRKARAAGIPSWSFIDHYTCMALRFSDAGEMVFPDTVVVLDEHARSLAIEDGIPEKKIFIHTNPYLDYIGRYWKPKQTESAIRATWGGAPGKKLVLYAPDPLSLRNEEAFWGFNEGEVLQHLITALDGIENAELVIKAHPLQPEAILENVIREAGSGLPAYILRSGDNLELMRLADVVIGFHSNFLLEAAALGKEIIRYFPQSVDKDPIRHLKTGVKVTSREELTRALQKMIWQ